MQITDRQLDKFIELYQKHFGVELDRESALAIGNKLAETTKLILEEQHAKYRKEVSKV